MQSWLRFQVKEKNKDLLHINLVILFLFNAALFIIDLASQFVDNPTCLKDDQGPFAFSDWFYFTLYFRVVFLLFIIIICILNCKKNGNQCWERYSIILLIIQLLQFLWTVVGLVLYLKTCTEVFSGQLALLVFCMVFYLFTMFLSLWKQQKQNRTDEEYVICLPIAVQRIRLYFITFFITLFPIFLFSLIIIVTTGQKQSLIYSLKKSIRSTTIHTWLYANFFSKLFVFLFLIISNIIIWNSNVAYVMQQMDKTFRFVLFVFCVANLILAILGLKAKDKARANDAFEEFFKTYIVFSFLFIFINFCSIFVIPIFCRQSAAVDMIYFEEQKSRRIQGESEEEMRDSRTTEEGLEMRKQKSQQ